MVIVMNESQKKIKGIWKRTKGYRGLLFTALIFDTFSAIPWVGLIFSFMGYLTLWLWMQMKGMSPGFSKKARHNAKKFGSVLFEGGAGAIGFGIVPGILLWAYFVINEDVEDKAENHQHQMKEVQKKLAKQSQQMDEQVRAENTRVNKRVITSAY